MNTSENGPSPVPSPVPGTGQDNGQVCLLFRVAASFWAMDVASVQRVLQDVTVYPVIGTQNWFPGLCHVDGQLLPVSDLALWLNLDVPDNPQSQPVIQLHPQHGLIGLRVTEVVGTQTLTFESCAPEYAEEPTEEPTDARLPGAAERTASYDGQVYRWVDVSALIQSPAFVAIGEVSVA